NFFGLPKPRVPQQREGAGSGFIATEDGYILTNNHVIRNASKIDVTLPDGRRFKAEVIGKDPATDIAVIHINTSGLPVARLGNSGIGFAIASNAVRDVFGKLVTSGRVSRGYLGVQVVPLTEARAHVAGLEPDSAVFVSGVPDSNSPAGRAGIRAGDIITTFNDKKVRAPRELTDLVAATPVGSKARIEFLRDGQPQTATVELVERPDDLTARQANPENDGDGNDDQPQGGQSQGRLGVFTQTITPELAAQLRLQTQTGA